ILHRQLDAAALVNVQHFHANLLPFFQVVRYVLHALVGDLRNVHETVFARQDRHECAEVNYTAYGTLVDRSNLGFGSNTEYAIDSGLGRILVGTVNADGAIVFDIDLRTGFLADRTDRGTALADNVANLVRIDLHRGHVRRVVGQCGTRRAEHAIHLTEDMQTRFQCLTECNLHDLLGDALDLDVHLQGGDAIGGAGYLEVHVA